MGSGGGVDGLQLLIEFGAQKGEGGDECAGADAGDDREFRPVAARGPAIQQPRAERTVGAAAGQGQRDFRERLASGDLPGPGFLQEPYMRLQ